MEVKQHLFKIWNGPKTCKKGCRCEKTGGRKLRGRGRKAGKEGCRVDREIRRQDYYQARCEAKEAIFKEQNDEKKWFSKLASKRDHLHEAIP